MLSLIYFGAGAISAAEVVLSASSNITASGENTTAQLTPPGISSFGGGRIQDDENPTDTVNIGLAQYREDEWCIELTADAVDGADYEFRVIDSDGTTLASYAQYPLLTVASTSTQVISLSAVTSRERFGASTITAGTVSATTTSILSTAKINSVVVSSQVRVSLSSINSGEQMGDISQISTYIISPASIPSRERLGIFVVTYVISVSSIPSQEAFGSVIVTVETGARGIFGDAVFVSPMGYRTFD